MTNNGFLDGRAFDGLRKNLAKDFDAIYILDLGGNARRGLKISDSNAFGIQVGVSINFFVKTRRNQPDTTRIFYYRTEERYKKEQIFALLEQHQNIGTVEWKTIQPDARYTWLTKGLRGEFATFIPMATNEAKTGKGQDEDVIFKVHSLGVSTNRNAWAYNFQPGTLGENIRRMIDTYNSHVLKWQHRKVQNSPVPNRDTTIDDLVINEPVDDFVDYDEEKISWSSSLKQKLKAGQIAAFTEDKIRMTLFRPFTKSNLYFDRLINDRVSLFPSIFPRPETEAENQVLWLKIGQEWPMFVLMANAILDLLPQGGSQCFPFYTYDEDGTNRRENITDWALGQFRLHYGGDTITKWNVFHYVYALLHHPEYRERFAADLKRDLPRIPYAPDFWGFANAGARLAEIHLAMKKLTSTKEETVRLLYNSSKSPVNHLTGAWKR